MPLPELKTVLPSLLGILVSIVLAGLFVAQLLNEARDARAAQMRSLSLLVEKEAANSAPGRRAEQRTFVYVLEDGSSIAAEAALGKLIQQGWRIVQVTGFAPVAARQALEAPATRGAASSGTMTNDLAALLVLEKSSP